MAPQITIDKIIISGFCAIKNATTIQFGKRINLIDGPANDVKLSIARAIDFMLNPHYHTDTFPPSLLHDSVANENDEAFVTLYISSDKKFTLNKKKSSSFVVTRYLREKGVDKVHYLVEGERKMVQPIQSFHADLIALAFTKIHDPLISQFTRPTSSELNQLVIEALHSNVLMEIFKVNKGNIQTREDERNGLQAILRFQAEHIDEAKKLLVSQRTLELLISEKSIEKIKAKYPDGDIDFRAKCRDFVMFTRVNELDTIQRERIETYQHTLQRAYDTQLQPNSMDLTIFRGILSAVSEKWETYVNDMKVTFENDWKSGLLNNKMVSMQASINNYYKEISGGFTEQIDDALPNCQKSIDAAKRCHEILHENDLVQKCEAMMSLIQQRIGKDLGEIDRFASILKNYAQRTLDEKIDSFDQMLDYLKCTNELATADLNIEKFCGQPSIMNPICIDAWRTGVVALNSEAAINMGMKDEYFGNVLCFVNPETDHSVLSLAFPTLMDYFASFIFETRAMAEAFGGIVKPLLKSGEEVFVCWLNDFALPRTIEIPYKSLSDYTLNDNIRSQTPEIMYLFDNFRVTTDKWDPKDRQEAIKCKCKILHEHGTFHEHGLYMTTNWSETVDAMKHFLWNWQKVIMTDSTEIKIKREVKKLTLEKELNAKARTTIKHANELFETKKKLIGILCRIVFGMKNLHELTDVWMKAKKEEINQLVDLEVIRKKNGLLKIADRNPVAGELQVLDELNVLDLHDEFTRFETHAEKIVHDLVNDLLPLTEDNIMKFKNDIEGKFNASLEPIDFKRNYNMLIAPAEPDGLVEMCIRKSANEEEQTQLAKCSWIKEYPELLDADKMKQLADSSSGRLEEMKNEIRVPDTMILPNLDTYYNMILDNEWLTHEYHGLISDRDCHSIQFMATVHFTPIYFDTMANVLESINSLDRQEDIGMQLNTTDKTAYIFKDPINPEWDQFPMEKLCDTSTGLSFIVKSSNNYIMTSDLIDVNSNRYSVLFQSVLSIIKNPSLVTLNNTILGLPIDELQKIISWLQPHTETEDSLDETEDNYQQMIVVGRSETSRYRELFKSVSFHEIRGSKINGQLAIDESDINA